MMSGYPAPKIYMDVMLAAYVLDSTEGNFSLERLAFSQLGVSLGENVAIDVLIYELGKIYEEKFKYSWMGWKMV